MAVILVVAVMVAVGGVGLPGVAPSHAVLAAVPADQSHAAGGGHVLEDRRRGWRGHRDAHKGWIEVLSWSWGASQAGSGGAGAGGAAGRLVGHVTIVKRIDKATPLLFKRCSDGTVLPLATVELARSGGGLTYLKYELNSVLVSSIAAWRRGW